MRYFRHFKRGIEEFWRPATIGDPSQAGRAWKTVELRRKGFEDLHKLWFVCLKEKNLLATEKHHCRANREEFRNPERLREVKKTMARIKLVVSERRKNRESLPETFSPVK